MFCDVWRIVILTFCDIAHCVLLCDTIVHFVTCTLCSVMFCSCTLHIQSFKKKSHQIQIWKLVMPTNRRGQGQFQPPALFGFAYCCPSRNLNVAFVRYKGDCTVCTRYIYGNSTQCIWGNSSRCVKWFSIFHIEYSKWCIREILHFARTRIRLKV
jgi:hypothetical protein